MSFIIINVIIITFFFLLFEELCSCERRLAHASCSEAVISARAILCDGKLVNGAHDMTPLISLLYALNQVLFKHWLYPGNQT